MDRLTRRERIAVAIWIVLAVVVWNGIFEMQVVRGVKEYLFHAALYDAGRGPLVPIAQVMDPAVYHATWVATLWASIAVLAGMLTLRFAATTPAHPRTAAPSTTPDRHSQA
jgi:hypothetical protein